MTPSLPTFSMTSAIRLPISLSLAVMVADLGDLLFAFDFGGILLELIDDGLGGLLDAPLESHVIGAGGNVLESAGDNGMGQNGGGSGAVAAGIIGLGGGFFDQLSAHILERIRKFDFFGDGYAIIDYRWSAPFLIQGHGMALGPQGYFDCVCQGIDPFFRECLASSPNIICFAISLLL